MSPVTAMDGQGWMLVLVEPCVWTLVQLLIASRMPAWPSGVAELRCGGRIAAMAASKVTGSVLIVFERRTCGVRPKSSPGMPWISTVFGL